MFKNGHGLLQGLGRSCFLVWFRSVSLCLSCVVGCLSVALGATVRTVAISVRVMGVLFTCMSSCGVVLVFGVCACFLCLCCSSC